MLKNSARYFKWFAICILITMLTVTLFPGQGAARTEIEQLERECKGSRNEWNRRSAISSMRNPAFDRSTGKKK